MLVFGELRPVDGGMSILLEKPSITVGQDRTCDVVIEHPSVSANHCHMEFRDGHWFIEDLGGGGISVNGEPVENAWVPALSVINIGAVEFDLQYPPQESESKNNGSVSEVMRAKLDRAVKSVQSVTSRRTQVHADQPAPAWVPMTKFGMLIPVDGQANIPLLYDELYLGRSQDCDVILPYLTVANMHCVLRFLEGHWSVRDLKNHGVTINGQPCVEGWLMPGDSLGVGTHFYEVDYSTTSAPPPEMAVPNNAIAVGDDESLSDADPDVFDVAESALIDSDDEIEVVEHSPAKCDNRSPANNTKPASEEEAAARVPVPPVAVPSLPPRLDEPPLASDAMLQSIEEVPPRTESVEKVTAEAKTIPPAETKTPIAKPPATTTPIPKKKAPAPSRQRKKSPATATVPQATAASLPQSSTATSAETATPQPDFVSSRRDQVRQFLKDCNFDGLLLTQPANFAWSTGGIDAPRGLFGQVTAAILMTPESATLLASQADRNWLSRYMTADAVLPHHECDWPGDSASLLADWLGSKKLASDQPFASCADVSSEVAALRLPLLPFEMESLRKLGIRVARTVERVAREFQRGDTEAQIAGDIASRLIRHEVVPEQIQVWGDGRGLGCQNWNYGRDPVERDCTISVVARRQGLHVAVSRTVSFGVPAKELRWTFADMLLAHATALTRSRDQIELASVWSEVERVCETLGEAKDWRATDPGCITGYQLCEAPISATSSLRLRAGMPVIWRSLIGPACAVDTVLVRESDSKVITQTGEWPQISVAVNNEQLFVQTVLQRTS